ncbi:hypothetical protein [Paenibacillus sp. GCM10027626]|uniref:hypothetical protein n=1 Tax=Paenibacillus sp. GCM10027626 TaxID=3273411 RepID=UPI003627593D
MKYLMAFIIACMLAGCSVKSGGDERPVHEQEKILADQLTIEAVILGKHVNKKYLLITEVPEGESPDFQANLKNASTQSTDEIIRDGEFELRWLDVSKLLSPDLSFETFKVGNKIQAVIDNMQVDTQPPISFAKEAAFLD